jgi:hypothetical protein
LPDGDHLANRQSQVNRRHSPSHGGRGRARIAGDSAMDLGIRTRMMGGQRFPEYRCFRWAAVSSFAKNSLNQTEDDGY